MEVVQESTDIKKKRDSIIPVYIQLTCQIRQDDFSYRCTIIEEGAFGIILTEDNIPTIHGISKAQQRDLLEMLKYAEGNNYVLALIAGHACWIKKHQFIKKTPACAIVPWVII